MKTTDQLYQDAMDFLTDYVGDTDYTDPWHHRAKDLLESMHKQAKNEMEQ